MKKILFLLCAASIVISMEADNVITYTATQRLSTTVLTGKEDGLHGNGFNLSFYHTYESGVGKLTFPGEVTTIGPNAFYNCKTLTSITIPSSITKIGESAFWGCTALSAVYISDIAAWCNISFDNSLNSNPLDKAHHLYVNGNEVEKLVIPDSIEIIKSRVFNSCYGLTSINIPNSVIQIKSYAFYNCSNVLSLVLGSNVASIEEGAFYDCSSLLSIIVEATEPPLLGSNAFSGVSKTIPVYVPKGSKALYETASIWSEFTNIKEMEVYNFNVGVVDKTQGIAEVITTPSMSRNAYFKATAFSDYEFTHWSDGNTNNPRSIKVTKDSTLFANFAKKHQDTIYVEHRDSIYFEVHDTTYINTINVNSSDSSLGKAILQVHAIPENGCQFVCWSDYNNSNPRTIDALDSTPKTYTAIFVGTPTKSQTVTEVQKQTKVIQDGQLFIKRNGKTYNAQGAIME